MPCTMEVIKMPTRPEQNNLACVQAAIARFRMMVPIFDEEVVW